MEIIKAGVVFGAIGLVFGLILGLADKLFARKADDLVEAIRKVLPGVNCGACGYAGCGVFAAAVAEGTAPVNGCPIGKAETAKRIAQIIGQDIEAAPTQ